MTEQDDFLDEFYSQVFEAFSGAGMTYRARYQASAAAPVRDCEIVLDSDVQTDGDYARVAGGRIEIGLRKSQVGEPAAGAFVTIVKSGKRYVLESRVADDEAYCRWVVGRG